MVHFTADCKREGWVVFVRFDPVAYLSSCFILLNHEALGLDLVVVLFLSHCFDLFLAANLLGYVFVDELNLPLIEMTLTYALFDSIACRLFMKRVQLFDPG